MDARKGCAFAKGSEESRSRKGGDSARRAKSKSTTANSGKEEWEQGYTEAEKKKVPHTRVAHGGGKWRHARASGWRVVWNKKEGGERKSYGKKEEEESGRRKTSGSGANAGVFDRMRSEEKK